MNLTGKGPLGQKKQKPKKNSAYLNKIRKEACCICKIFNETQLSPTQAHHPIMERYQTKKADDLCAIPLCEGHHTRLFDTSKVAIHREPQKWQSLYGMDYNYSRHRPIE